MIDFMGGCKCPFHNCPNSSYDSVNSVHDLLHGDSNVDERMRQASMNSGICVSCIQKYREHPH
jgi:hypothetical protein